MNENNNQQLIENITTKKGKDAIQEINAKSVGNVVYDMEGIIQ